VRGRHYFVFNDRKGKYDPIIARCPKTLSGGFTPRGVAILEKELINSSPESSITLK
jgi:hypothetical protein